MGRVMTSSPGRPVTGCPSESQAAAATPSAGGCRRPTRTGAVGTPPRKMDAMSVPPLTEASQTSPTAS